jgi:hypothetical protein
VYSGLPNSEGVFAKPGYDHDGNRLDGNRSGGYRDIQRQYAEAQPNSLGQQGGQQQSPVFSDEMINPQLSPKEAHVRKMMMERGMGRRDVMANQKHAIGLGADADGNGIVTGKEWKKYQDSKPQNMPNGIPPSWQQYIPQQQQQQQPQPQPQQQLQTGGGLGMDPRAPRDMTAHEPGNPTTMPQGMPQVNQGVGMTPEQLAAFQQMQQYRNQR